MKLPKNEKAFTLIELLLVVAIIATLAVVVFVALNPAQRLKDSKDARRTSDVDTILSAVHEYIIDNKGVLPTTSPLNEIQLGTSAVGCAIGTGTCSANGTACLDLTSTLNKYLKSIPIDPTGVVGATKYTMAVDSNNIVTVKACAADTSTISASR